MRKEDFDIRLDEFENDYSLTPDKSQGFTDLNRSGTCLVKSMDGSQ